MNSRSEENDRDGFALIAILILLVAASAFLLAAAEELRSARFAQAARDRQRRAADAREYVEAVLITRLRAAITDATWPPTSPLASSHSSTSAVDDSRVGVRFAAEYPPPELAAFGLDDCEPFSVEGEVWSRAIPAQCRTIARDPLDGRPRTVVREVRSIPETATPDLAAAIELQLRALPETAAPLTSTGAFQAAEWTARTLRELASDAALASDWQRVGAELRARLATAPLIEAGAAAALESRLDALLAVLDPVPRLRRTNAHPARVDGKDRGHFAAPGPTLSAWPSGDYRLRVDVKPAAAAPGARVLPTPSKSTERAIEVCRVHRIAAEDEANAPTLLQPGGSEKARALEGPEDLCDRHYSLGSAVELDGAAAGVAVEPECWRVLPGGLIGVGRSATSAAVAPRVIASVLARAGALQLATEPLPTVDAPVCFVVPLLTGGFVFGATNSLWFTTKRASPSAGSAPAAADAATWSVRRVALESPLVNLHSVGGKLMAVLASAELRLYYESGDLVTSKYIAGLRGGGVCLPLADAVLFPPAHAISSWTVVDANLEPHAIGGPTLDVFASELHADGCAGLWWTSSTVASSQVWHAELVDDALEVATYDLTHESSGFALPPLVSAAFANRKLLAVVGADARALLLRRTGAALAECGLVALPQRPDALRAESGGEGALWIVNATRIWRVTLAAAQPKHPEFGWQLALAPRTTTDSDRDFRAPLVGDFRATLANGAHLIGAGTCNHGGSVLRAPDLSDLFVDGLYVSPLRGEHLSFEWEVAGASFDSGVGELWVKPERAASAEPEPEEPRALVTLRQHGSVRFTPEAEWVRRFHPAAPPVLHSFTLHGAPTRPLEATSTIERRPLDTVWCHRRTTELVGIPWRIEAWVPSSAAPRTPTRLADWTIDRDDLVGDDGSTVCVPDTASAGDWTRIGWRWLNRDRAALTVDGVSPHADPAPSSEPPEFAAAFAREFDAATLELGGAASGRSFRGTLRALAIDWHDDDGDDDAATLGATYEPASGLPQARLVLGPYAPGTKLVAVHASGAFPLGTSVRWQVTEVGPSDVRSSLGEGRTMRLADAVALAGAPNPGFDAREVSTWIVALWLVPSADGERAPLIEELSAVLLSALDDDRSR
ncbi:MAG: hypothetical protein ACKVX7_04905 [Planctomycetota bacterium]